MKLIDIGKIIVAPFEFYSIQEIKIEKKLNEHSTLYVCGTVREEKQFTPATDKTESVKISCENDGQIYFKGVIQSVKVTCEGTVYRLEVHAISNTILLDTVRHKRSFQDNSENYQAIVERIIADNNGAVTYNAIARNVENIILQYNETDWEFAKRLASHTNDVLIPIVDDKPAFHFGVPDIGGAKLNSSEYSISKEFSAIRWFSTHSSIEKGKGNDSQKMTAADVTLYCVETDDYLCDIGEKLNFNDASLYVCRLSMSYEHSALNVVYTLCPKKAVSRPKFYNPAITGLVLDGNVVEVENDTLKLDLSNDTGRGVEQDTGDKYFFKYATGYSMEEHTGWYVMPEEGDTVQLLFPIEDEGYAYATSAVRRDQTERTLDHMVKYWRTSYGREIKMDKDEILISTVDDETYIRINKDKDPGIEIITQNRILVTSGSTINIESEDDMTIITEKKLYIEAKDSIIMVSGGNHMSFDELGKAGISIATDKEFKLLSENNALIDGRQEIAVKSGKDMKIDSGSNLLSGAEKKIEIACGGSSIMLDSSGIDIKGSMIREN